MPSKNNVFLSYAHSDRAITTETVEKLASLGLIQSQNDLFLDKDALTPGSSWRDALRNAIDAASTVVVLWSKAASESASVNYEAGMAEALGKRIIVVLPDDETVAIPEDLQNVEIVRLKDVA